MTNSEVKDAKNLYIVDDRQSIKNYTNQDVRYWLRMGTVPTIEQIVFDILDNDDAITYDYEEAKRAANKEWLEMISVYDFAKNIQNLVSFNMVDSFDESKHISKKYKLKIRESIETKRYIGNVDRRFENEIAQYLKSLGSRVVDFDFIEDAQIHYLDNLMIVSDDRTYKDVSRWIVDTGYYLFN